MAGTYQTVARVGEIPEGEGRPFEVDGRTIAVILDGGDLLRDRRQLPAPGRPALRRDRRGQDGHLHLARLAVQPRGRPWLDSPKSKVRVGSYPVRVEGDEIQVLV